MNQPLLGVTKAAVAEAWPPGCAAVLVVDDEPDFLATYQRLLRRQGYETVTATTRQHASQIVQSTRLSLVITDLRLPDGDGLDVVRAVCTIPNAAPVIVVTGFGSAATRRAVLAEGASGYLQKPFAVTEFSALVRKVLRRSVGDGPR